MTPPAEPAIAPLARRLAEENAVAWRALKGSGPGGGVNERDVLGHLEAVMLGHPPAPKPRVAHTEPLGDAPWAAELALPIAPTPLTPVQTFEAEYRAALADLEALRAEVVRLQAEEERGRAEGRELGELRETVKTQADALAKVRALEAQVGELRGALADAQRETRRAQEHGTASTSPPASTSLATRTRKPKPKPNGLRRPTRGSSKTSPGCAAARGGGSGARAGGGKRCTL